MAKAHSQTSRDRLAFNFFIAIPVVAVLVLIHRAQAAAKSP
jgi:hypothetical protein